MAVDFETLALAKKYTDGSISGISGSLAGKNCTISSITDITGGHRVTFQWTADDSTTKTQAMDVMDGEDGKGIASASVNENNHLIITYTDGTTTDAGEIEITAAVDSVNGETGDVVLTASDLSAYTSAETDAKIQTEIEKLDVSDSAVSGSYVTAVSEADGKISVTREASDATPTEDSTKMVQSGGVYSSIVANTQLISDTVGWVGKNRLKIPSSVVSSDIYTVNRNSDGEVTSIVANGTPSAQSNFQLVANFTLDKPMILSGCPSGGSADDYFIYAKDSNNYYYYDYGNGVTLPSGSYSIIQITTRANVSMSNKEFRPMLSEASSTFEPYHETVDAVKYNRSEANVLGAKNRYKTSLSHIIASNIAGTWSDNVYTIGSLAITINDDMSVTLNGTSGGTSVTFILHSRTDADNFIDAGNYLISAQNATSNTFVRFFTTRNGSAYVYGDISDNNSTQISVLDTDIIGCLISIAANTTFSNVTLYPMLRLASDTDSTYQPYAMTNRELTESKMTYTDNGVLGAKNLWDESHSFNTKTGVTYTLTDHVYTINALGEEYSGIYIAKATARQYYSNYVGVRAKMVFEIKGDDTFNVQTINNVVTSVSTEYKRVETSISDLSQIEDIVFYNRTTTAHTITVKNLMIVLASDTDDTYVPYTMTNRELTEKVTPTSTALTITQNEYFEMSGPSHFIKKMGNLCELYSQFKCLTSNASWTQLNADIPKPFNMENIYIDVYPNGTTGTPVNVEISNSQGLRLSGGEVNKFYNVHVIYICV